MTNNQPEEHLIVPESEEVKRLWNNRKNYSIKAEIYTAALKEILSNAGYHIQEVIKAAVSELNEAIQMIDYCDRKIEEQRKIDEDNLKAEIAKQESKEILGNGGKN